MSKRKRVIDRAKSAEREDEGAGLFAHGAQSVEHRLKNHLWPTNPAPRQPARQRWAPTKVRLFSHSSWKAAKLAVRNCSNSERQNDETRFKPNPPSSTLSPAEATSRAGPTTKTLEWRILFSKRKVFTPSSGPTQAQRRTQLRVWICDIVHHTRS